MKREASKKSKLWLWLVIGAVVLLAVGGVTAFLLMSGSNTDATEPTDTTGIAGEATGGRPELYWNVDRAIYTQDGTTSTREPGEDGAYKIRFAYNGTLVEKSVADKKLVNYIDTLDALGLVFDDNGNVVDAVAPKTIAKEIAKNAFVKTVSGDTIESNTSVAMNGMTIMVKVVGEAEVYDVTPEAEAPGQVMNVGALKPMDTLTVYGDEEGNVTHVFVTGHSRESKVYWRADQFYNSTEKSTTREPDENGVYTVPFFCEGEVVELKFKDKALVTKIDSISRWKCHFGLTFDEEGYVVEQFVSSLGIAGLIVADCWDVVDIQGDYVYLQRLTTNDGSTWEGTIPAGTIIYEAGVKAKQEGEGGRQIDSLQMGDRVTVWTDTTGNVILVYVSERLVDCPAFWLPTRKYNSTTKETTREVGASGYYEVELLKEGSNKKEIFYVKDKATMSYIDSQTTKIIAAELESGNVIKYAYNAETLTGYTTATRGGVVTKVTGSIVTKITYGKRDTESNLILAVDAKVYNASGYGTLGAETTIQPGDHIYAQRQPTGELKLVYITKRTIGGNKLYWNLEIKWDKTNKVSTREADAEGWYYFEMAHQGKQVTLKTQNPEIVEKIDKLSIGACGLDVKGDVITNVYDAGYPYGGNKVASGYKYQYRTSDGGYFCTYASDANKTVEFKMASDCVIYNVSTVYDEFQGEKITSIPKNAMLTVFCDIYGEAKVVYVRSQSVKEMYWKTEILYDSTNKVTKRTPDADGYYWFNLANNGECKAYKTKDQKIANSMDSYAGAFGLKVKGDEILGFVSTTSVLDCGGNGYTTATITKISGRKITVEHSKGTDVITLSSDCKIYDVSPIAESFGAVTQLKVGDVIRTYVNAAKTEHTYVYVKSRPARVNGETGYCAVCEKTVTWKPMDGSSSITAADGHWYVPANMTQWVQSTFASESKDFTICLDLNGKTLTRAENGRNFRVAYNETLNIMDSVGGGKIVTNGGTSYNGGMFMISSGGTVNMYGGTLEFVDKGILNGYGGIVYLSGDTSEFNLYDGVVTGGISYAHSADKLGCGGNFYLVSGATLNMYGGEISGGKVYGILLEKTNATTGATTYSALNAQGGNIYFSESSNVNIYGGVIKDGEAVRQTFGAADGKEYTNMSFGGNIYKVNTNKLDGKLYIENATVSGGEAHRGGNIFTTSGSAGLIELKNATISDGHATQFGGNIMSIGGQWTVVNSVIENGVSDSNGGNIYSQGGVFQTVTDSTISGGESASGGNIYLYKNKTDENIFVVGEGTVIENGSATTGGNFYVAKKNYVQLADGKVVAPADNDGTGVALLPALAVVGGEIRNGQADTGANIYSAGHMTIQSGKISGGDISFVGNSEAMLDIAGGEVDCELSVKTPASFEINGAPKIANLVFDKNVKATLGELTEGADIKVTTSNGSPIFTMPNEAAAEYLAAGYISGYAEGSTVTVTADNELSLEAAPLATKTFFCNHCNAEVEFIPWEGASSEKIRENVHYYLTKNESITNSYYAGGSSQDTAADGVNVVFELNGYNITSTGTVFYVYPNSTLTVQDSKGTSVLSGAGTLRKSAPGEGGLIYVEKGNLNIYGGTFTLTNGEKVSNGGIIRNGGTTKIYGGTFNGNTVNGIGDVIYSTNNLQVYGGTFNGTVYAKSTLTLGGAPVIETLQIPEGTVATLNELTAGADITVEAAGIFTKPNTNAKAYVDAGYIKSGTSTEITVTVLNELTIGEVVIEGLLEYACPHCNGAIAQWLPYDANDVDGVLVGSNAHYYIPEGGYDQSYGQVSIQGEITLDFHGQTLTGKDGKRLWRVEGTFNIVDTIGGGKAVADGLENNGGALAMTRANPNTGDKAVINMYSGILTMTENCKTSSNGGILNLDGGTIMNMFGGEIYGGKTYGNGANINIANGALNMQGGFIDGGVYVGTSGKLNLSGTAKIANTNGGVKVSSGKLLELGTFETGAEIFVSVDETAVITDTLTGANDYLAYIKPAEAGWNLVVSGNALLLTNGEAPFDPNAVYEQAKAMDFTTDDPEGKVTAVCPVCREEVEWMPLANNQTDAGVSLDAGHYYLSADIDYTQNTYHYNVTCVDTVCVNLNGQNLANVKPSGNNSKGRVFYTEKSGTVLNIMGEGTVTGSGYISDGKGFGVIDLTTTANIFGGTYVSTGVGPAIGNRKTSSGDAVLSIYAGTTVINENDDGCAIFVLKNASLVIAGGTFNGIVMDSASKGVTVSGAPVIGTLDLTAGSPITVETLTAGADITVLANGVFTSDFANAQAYLEAGYFKSGVADTEVKVEGDALAIATTTTPEPPVTDEPEEVDPNEVYEQAKAMDFTAGGTVKALCPACGEEHDWQPIPAPTSSKNSPTASGAYYVAEDMEVTKFWYFLEGKTCINLNGKTITNANDRVFYIENEGTVLNVMGEGTVTGKAKYNSGNTNFIGVVDACAAVNLYGGSWKSTTEYPTICARGSKAYTVVNIYEGTEIVRTSEDVAGLNVYIADGSTVNMYGGIISGGTAINYPANDQGKIGGNVLLRANAATKDYDYDCALNILGGVIENGTAEDGGANVAAIGNDLTNPSATINNSKGIVAADTIFVTGANAAVNGEVCPHCGVAMDAIEWVELVLPTDAQLVLTESGHYYLSQDIPSIFKQIGVKGGDVVVDFRGHTITSTTNTRGFYVGDENTDTACTLSLIDSVGGGGVSSAYTSAGAALYIITTNKVTGATTNVLNVYGGTYSVTVKSGSGGAIANSRSLVNVYDGTFNGAVMKNDTSYGGCVYTNGGTTNVYGGTFTTGDAAGAGDGFYVTDYTKSGTTWQGVLNVYGGEIGGQVLVKAGAEIAIEGAAVIEKLELESGVVIKLGKLTSGADITVLATGTFAEASANAQAYVNAGYIKAASGKEITVEGNTLSMAAAVLRTRARAGKLQIAK